MTTERMKLTAEQRKQRNKELQEERRKRSEEFPFMYAIDYRCGGNDERFVSVGLDDGEERLRLWIEISGNVLEKTQYSETQKTSIDLTAEDALDLITGLIARYNHWARNANNRVANARIEKLQEWKAAE